MVFHSLKSCVVDPTNQNILGANRTMHVQLRQGAVWQRPGLSPLIAHRRKAVGVATASLHRPNGITAPLRHQPYLASRPAARVASDRAGNDKPSHGSGSSPSTHTRASNSQIERSQTQLSEVIEWTINLPWQKFGSWMAVVFAVSQLKEFFGVCSLHDYPLLCICALDPTYTVYLTR